MAECGVNMTCSDTDDVEDSTVWWKGLIVAVLAVVFLMATVGNLLVILVVAWIPEMRTRTNMFLVNLSISGLGVASCIPFSWITLLRNDWIFGSVWCKINGFMNPFWLTASIFTLLAISVHKYFTIVKPLRRVITRSRAVLMIVLTWAAAILCAIGPLIGWNQIVYEKNSAQCGPDSPDGSISNTSHVLFILVVVYVLPILIMSTLYWKIYCAVDLHCKRLRKNSTIDSKGVQAQKRLIITLCIVVVVYFLCWGPFCLHGILLLVVHENDFSGNFSIVAYIFGYSNAACNPLIFAFRNKRYRRGFKEIISCIACSPLKICTKSDIAKPPAPSTMDLVEGSTPSPAEFYNMEKRCSIWFLPERPGAMSLQLEPVTEENNHNLEQEESTLQGFDDGEQTPEKSRKDSRGRSRSKEWRIYILRKVGWIETNV